MFFDIVIFLIPLTEYFRPGLRKKQLLAMTGLFAMGLLVVLMAILRLWATFRHSSDAIKSFDFTWYDHLHHSITFVSNVYTGGTPRS